jgi:hypothetical protein
MGRPGRSSSRGTKHRSVDRFRLSVFGKDHLTDILVMRVARLDLLGDGVHVAEAAFERIAAEYGRGAGSGRCRRPSQLDG